MPIAHPQTKGGQFCVWNDMTSYGGGFTWFDIYDRFIDAVMITSEKLGMEKRRMVKLLLSLLNGLIN